MASGQQFGGMARIMRMTLQSKLGHIAASMASSDMTPTVCSRFFIGECQHERNKSQTLTTDELECRRSSGISVPSPAGERRAHGTGLHQPWQNGCGRLYSKCKEPTPTLRVDLRSGGVWSKTWLGSASLHLQELMANGSSGTCSPGSCTET